MFLFLSYFSVIAIYIFHNIILIFLDFTHHFLAKCIFYCLLINNFLYEEIVQMIFLVTFCANVKFYNDVNCIIKIT